MMTRYCRSETNAGKEKNTDVLLPCAVGRYLYVRRLRDYGDGILMNDETCITIMINDEFVAMPLKEAARVYQRLGDLLDADHKYPKGMLFDHNKPWRDPDD